MNSGKDMFASIASLEIDESKRNIKELKPIEKNERLLPLEGNKVLFEPSEKMSTQEELEKTLVKERAYYKKFLEDMAPKLVDYRVRKVIKQFDWRIGTKEDQRNFSKVLLGEGEWEQLETPHYGAPLGKKTTYYRTEIHLDKDILSQKMLYICFKGVDYEATVFINGNYAGNHEGFFAPFEFNIQPFVSEGINTLVIKVDNDFTQLESIDDSGDGIRYSGDKIYAATGPGFDDPQTGWHHCPAGMGVYQDVYLESRNSMFIQDVFVRPILEESKAEVWVEVHSEDQTPKDFELNVSIYGQNFKAIVVENQCYEGVIERQIGVGDSLEETKLKASGMFGKPIKLQLAKGVNYFKVKVPMDGYRLWALQEPWLYQAQVTLKDGLGEVLDTRAQHFGMRSFTMDTETKPKGNFYLNGQRIRLRGANTMGHLQQCVIQKDWDQLLDDLLLAKICNMNFIRLTQRPVQAEIYDFCDKLGLMLQTDLPLFGKLRTNKYCEALKQVEEMEKLVRAHPSNVIGSYINEPFPNGDNKPHRYITKEEFENFFVAANDIVKMQNPDRVMKHVDGDYDPPTTSFPDNHCYNVWYNGNGVDVGKQSKGYWIPIKPDWNYGCGEFGAEGLEPVEFMRRKYPTEWLPQNVEEEKKWTPNEIVGAQTGKFHYCFFETPKSLADWVSASRKYQGEAIRRVTESFRRDPRNVSCAIHLFIDAWPSGWMKTIMDQDRVAKPGYFAYKEALTPLMVSLRTDNNKYMFGDTIRFEAWVCNDTNSVPKNSKIAYYMTMNDSVIAGGETSADVSECEVTYQGLIEVAVPKVSQRNAAMMHLALIDHKGQLIHDTSYTIEVFPEIELNSVQKIFVCGAKDGIASKLAGEVEQEITEEIEQATYILVDDYMAYQSNKRLIDQRVAEGANLVALELSAGEYLFADKSVKVKSSSLLPLHLVSRDTEHPMVNSFKANDFKDWYDARCDYITPFIADTFTSEDFRPILNSGNTDDEGIWKTVQGCGETDYGEGKIFICQVNLVGRTMHNPIARAFVKELLALK